MFSRSKSVGDHLGEMCTRERCVLAEKVQKLLQERRVWKMTESGCIESRHVMNSLWKTKNKQFRENSKENCRVSCRVNYKGGGGIADSSLLSRNFWQNLFFQLYFSLDLPMVSIRKKYGRSTLTIRMVNAGDAKNGRRSPGAKCVALCRKHRDL